MTSQNGSIENLREPKFFNTWIMRIAINISTGFYNKKNKQDHDKLSKNIYY